MMARIAVILAGLIVIAVCKIVARWHALNVDRDNLWHEIKEEERRRRW